MYLLLVTSRWPHAAVPEFLDDEIAHLARHFDRIVVAPMRPRGPLTARLPDQVEVDLSLADHLVRSRLYRSRSLRGLTVMARAAQTNPAGVGFSRSDLLADGRQRSWIRRALLNRADTKSVAQWAAARRPPNLAYTFWLGAATVGLRQGWPDVSLVSRAHGGDLFSEAHHWASIPYQRAALESADLIASVSDRGRAYLARKYPDIAPKLTWRRLGIPDIGGPAIPAGSTSLRLLSASSIDANKRVLLIAEVAISLARSGHAVRWTHLGDGPSKGAVERATAECPGNLVVDLRGQVPLQEVHQQLTSGGYDVFINLSLSEGAPVSLMEAQCVGLPVVATAVGGSPEVVPAALNELARREASLADLRAAVLRASSRPPEEAQLRRDHWARNYDAVFNYAAWAAELAGLARSGA